MLRILLIIVIGWVVLGLIGFLVKALFWLFVLACIGFAVTLALGGFRGGRKSLNR
ncbi:MAG: hypothetical protein ACR2JQ_00395 [Mycobacteriales bacterium]